MVAAVAEEEVGEEKDVSTTGVEEGEEVAILIGAMQDISHTIMTDIVEIITSPVGTKATETIHHNLTADSTTDPAENASIMRNRSVSME